MAEWNRWRLTLPVTSKGMAWQLSLAGLLVSQRKTEPPRDTPGCGVCAVGAPTNTLTSITSSYTKIFNTNINSITQYNTQPHNSTFSENHYLFNRSCNETQLLLLWLIQINSNSTHLFPNNIDKTEIFKC